MKCSDQTSKKRYARLVYNRLLKQFPIATCDLNYDNPLQLLIATILSAQCTDKRVNEVTANLFADFHSPQDYVDAPNDVIMTYIHRAGFYRNKSKSIQKTCQRLIDHYNSQVPDDFESLTSLTGVGRKTAHVVRAYAFEHPAMICDTHVLRVSFRLGLTTSKDPYQVEMDLCALMPKSDWTMFCTVLLKHGRHTCASRTPQCANCMLKDRCLWVECD